MVGECLFAISFSRLWGWIPSLDDTVPPLVLPSGTVSDIELVDLFGRSLCTNIGTISLAEKPGAEQHWSLSHTIFSPTKTFSIVDMSVALLFSPLLPYQFGHSQLFTKPIILVCGSASRHSAKHYVISIM
jgi:hypothetical protein